jgi:hypothetical protein
MEVRSDAEIEAAISNLRDQHAGLDRRFPRSISGRVCAGGGVDFAGADGTKKCFIDIQLDIF